MAQTKKIIKIGTPVSSQEYIMNISEEDEEKTVNEVLLEYAELLERQQDIEARNMVENLDDFFYFVNGVEIAKDTKISDLNFEMEYTESGSASWCKISLRDQHAGG